MLHKILRKVNVLYLGEGEKSCINYTSLKSLLSMKAKIGTTHKFIQTNSVHQAKK